MRKILLSALLASAAFGLSAAEYAEINGLWYELNATAETAKPVKPTQIWPLPSGMDWSDLENIKYTGDVVVPASVEYGGKSYQVTEIAGSCFNQMDGLTSVSLPEGILSIGQDAFSYAVSLTEIVVPNTVTAIGNNAFMGCRNLKTVTVGSGVETMGMNVFKFCGALTEVYVLATVPPALGNYAFTGTVAKNVYVPAESVDAYKASAWAASDTGNTIVAIGGGSDIPATSIELNYYEWTGVPGSTLQLEATVMPEEATDKTVTWTSSHPEYVTVDENGLVTLLADGTAIITASCGEAIAECEVVVDHNVGIEAVEAGENAKARYFNLQGIEVLNPAEGQMVIERKGDKVRKVVL